MGVRMGDHIHVHVVCVCGAVGLSHKLYTRLQSSVRSLPVCEDTAYILYMYVHVCG